LKVLIHVLLFVGWSEEAVSKAEILRLIYQGRFLHSNVTLGALGLPLGKTTVMHLVPRENLPEPNSQGENKCFSLAFFTLVNVFKYIISLISTLTMLVEN
jgi:hypothetical protein